MAEFSPNWVSFRLEPEKIGAKRAQARNEFGSTHGEHKPEGTVPGGTCVAKSCERWYAVICSSSDVLNAKLYAEKYQLEIVKADGLQPLLRLLQSTYLPLILSSAACVRNVSIHPQNESPIIESGFLQPLINLLSFKDNEEVQCHAISTLRNLAASSEKNKLAIVKAGAVHSIKELVLDVPMNVQSEMTACVAVLALSDELKGQLLEMGICEVLIPLTNSPSSEVQGNSAAALGNLSSKG
jgi:vacuolar protein 8